MRRYFIPNQVFFIALALFLLSPVLLVAQETGGFFADMPLQDMLAPLITVLTLFFTWLIVKVLIPKIPNWLIPILTGTIFPWLINWLMSLASATGLEWWQASLYGALSTVVHQVYKQLKDRVN